VFCGGCLAAIALEVGPGCLVEENCHGDAECGSGKICVEETCRAGCRLTRDCPDGQTCEANRCVTTITDGDADSDTDEDCSVECPENMAPICGFCIDYYEASRDDATETSSGTNEFSPAKSVAGVRPWINLTRETAVAACERADKRLCTHEEWIRACRGSADTEYPYGDTYEPATCNGIDTYGRGNQRMMPTGSFPGCTNDYGIFDISGNVWEIDQDVPGWVHGGAYNCIDSQSLHLCSYNENFGTGPRSNVGFRCCRDGI
jgi:hypothetical protein